MVLEPYIVDVDYQKLTIERLNLLIQLRHKVPVSNISVISVLLPERERERERERQEE